MSTKTSLDINCNRLSPKCKSQPLAVTDLIPLIVTDYRLNANHNYSIILYSLFLIVTDYRLNANHNMKRGEKVKTKIVTDYRLNANHNRTVR